MASPSSATVGCEFFAAVLSNVLGGTYFGGAFRIRHWSVWRFFLQSLVCPYFCFVTFEAAQEWGFKNTSTAFAVLHFFGMGVGTFAMTCGLGLLIDAMGLVEALVTVDRDFQRPSQ